MLNVHKIFHGSRIYGPGIRDVIWFKGCTLHCKGCINPELWSNDPECLYEPSKLANEVSSGEVTLLGGEPLQQEEILEFIRELKARDIGIILFTGYEFDALKGKKLEAAKMCDCVISGPFNPLQKDDSLYLMGSRNQRLDLFSDRYSRRDFEKPNSYEILIKNSIELHGRSKRLVEEFFEMV